MGDVAGILETRVTKWCMMGVSCAGVMFDRIGGVNAKHHVEMDVFPLLTMKQYSHVLQRRSSESVTHG